MGYRIKTISELIGVPRNTLLAWERRYNIVNPVRQANGYREYSEADLARLRAIKRFLDRGHRISEAISLSEAEPAAVEGSDTEDPAALRTELFELLLSLDRAGADRRLRQVVSMSYTRRLDTIFTPMLRETGARWETGELSVAQEHYISSFCRDHLTAMLLSLDHGPTSGPVTVCASWSEDQHDLALLSIAIKLALKGSRIIFLGARTPLSDLMSLCETHKPAQICLSVTVPVTADALEASARKLASLECAVVIGGQGLPAGGLPEIPGVRWARSSREV